MLAKRSLLLLSVSVVAAVMVLSCLGSAGVRAASGVINDFESPLTVTKLKGNPESSKVLRAWICPTYDCQWHQWIENAGLKALTVEIFEGQASNGVVAFSTTIVFEKHGTYPSGTVQLPDFQPKYACLYNIVLTPIGHKEKQALYYHTAEGKYAPVSVVTTSSDIGTVTVDATGSYDPDGWIVSYEWHWSDGAYETGPTSTHFYMPGDFLSVSLTITDNDGLEGGMIINFGWW
jgi:hypothetical protein